ncbi:MAG: hypothetical protein U5N58_05525 [Actinomycetota bacterium]|nr:hypothetical protein [Actinomycetota bacterium]
MHKQRGNISLIILTAAGILILLLVLLFDLCQIFKERERTKNASDSVVLSVSQNLLYF